MNLCATHYRVGNFRSSLLRMQIKEEEKKMKTYKKKYHNKILKHFGRLKT